MYILYVQNHGNDIPTPAMLVCAGVYLVVGADWPGAGHARSLGWPGLTGV